jgi:transcriptional regulator with XRE-family HTH domain
MTLGERIRELRQQFGMSQDELGRKLKINGKQICRYELGGITPSIYTVKKFADIFGVSIDFLLEGKEKGTEEINDRELRQYFKVIDGLSGKKKEITKSIIKSLSAIEKI